MLKRNILIIILGLVLSLAFCNNKESKIERKKNVDDTIVKDSDKKLNEGNKKYSIRLQWLPQAQFAGYYVAKEKGFYSDEGLEIEIKHSNSNINIFDKLDKGEDDFITSIFATAIIEKSRGRNIVNIAQMMQKGALKLISKSKSGIAKAEDFNGKKIGNWGGVFSVQIEALINKKSLKDVKLVNQGIDMSKFMNDEIDIASVMTYNEYHIVLASGMKEDEINLIDFEDYDLNFPEDCIITTNDMIKNNKDDVVKFLRASIKGWKYAFNNKDEAIEIVMKNDVKNKEHQIRMLNEIEKLYLIDGINTKIGQLDDKALSNVVTVLKDMKLLENEIQVKDSYNKALWEEAVK